MVVLALASITGVAHARSDMPWDGGYFGVNLGYPSTSNCNSWALSGAGIDGALASEFSNQNCSAGALVGGVQKKAQTDGLNGSLERVRRGV